MQLYQISNTFTAAICAAMFVAAARVERDKLTRVSMIVWAIAMAFAAAAGPLIAFTELDAWITLAAKAMTPIGWGALAICAARKVSRRG